MRPVAEDLPNSLWLTYLGVSPVSRNAEMEAETRPLERTPCRPDADLLYYPISKLSCTGSYFVQFFVSGSYLLNGCFS